MNGRAQLVVRQDRTGGKWLPRVIDLCNRLKITGGGKLKDTDRLEGVLKGGIPDGNCLIMTAGAVDKRKRLFKTITDVGVVLSFLKSRSESGQKGLFMDTVKNTLEKKGNDSHQMPSSRWAKRRGSISGIP